MTEAHPLELQSPYAADTPTKLTHSHHVRRPPGLRRVALQHLWRGQAGARDHPTIIGQALAGLVSGSGCSPRLTNYLRRGHGPAGFVAAATGGGRRRMYHPSSRQPCMFPSADVVRRAREGPPGKLSVETDPAPGPTGASEVVRLDPRGRSSRSRSLCGGPEVPPPSEGLVQTIACTERNAAATARRTT